jgi:hypothetical protein
MQSMIEPPQKPHWTDPKRFGDIVGRVCTVLTFMVVIWWVVDDFDRLTSRAFLTTVASSVALGLCFWWASPKNQ